MITRRSFLAALACLPFVGKFMPKPTAYIASVPSTMFTPAPSVVESFKRQERGIWLRYEKCYDIDGRVVHGSKCACNRNRGVRILNA